MTTNHRRILLIAYHFPPSAAVGGRRIADFARHLPSLGWDPRVLTIRDEDVEKLDPARLRGVEDVPVRKARVLPSVLRAAARLRAAYRRLVGAKRADPGPEPSGEEAGTTSAGESVAGRIKRYILSFLLLPDLENRWIPPATVAALREVRRHRVDWILTSCPPYSVHVIGLAVKSLTGRRWAADFRDPWMTADPKALVPMSALSIGIEAWLERKVVEKADLVLFNVDRLRDAYRRKYAHVPAHKFVYIPNGIPRGHANEGGDPADKYDVFTLSYTGSLYVGRSPEPIFRAVSDLIRGGKVRSDEIRIKLVGECRLIDGVPVSEIIDRYGLDSVVEVIDAVPHAEAAEIIRRSHLALLFAARLAYQIPAKVYDYFSAGTRILAIAGEGATADLVRETDTGATFLTDDVDGIAAFIHDELTAPRSKDGASSTALKRFDTRSLTEELAVHLDQVTARDGRD